MKEKKLERQSLLEKIKYLGKLGNQLQQELGDNSDTQLQSLMSL